MDMENRPVAEGRDREMVVKALTIAIAAMDANRRGLAAEPDRGNMAELLMRLAGESELELYRQHAMTLISGIADRHAG